MKLKVSSDRAQKFKNENDFLGPVDVVPVDLYGARTDYQKGEDNLSKAARDFKERFDFDLPLKNGSEK